MFADEGDVLVAISSSGRSENILLGVQAAKSKGCRIVTISGFDENNPLASLGEINFYVPSKAYGPVEVLHHSICHCIIDSIMKVKNG
jgi:D-sedoheptulose 7-phosphate isomerase